MKWVFVGQAMLGLAGLAVIVSLALDYPFAAANLLLLFLIATPVGFWAHDKFYVPRRDDARERQRTYMNRRYGGGLGPR